MMFLTGLALLGLGLLSGGLLVLVPLGLVAARAGTALWFLFPALTVIGYFIAASAADDARVPILSRVSGVLLVLLAVGSAGALVLQSAGFLQPATETASLWYVLALGLGLGGAGLASHRDSPGTRGANG